MAIGHEHTTPATHTQGARSCHNVSSWSTPLSRDPSNDTNGTDHTVKETYYQRGALPSNRPYDVISLSNIFLLGHTCR